MSEPDGVIDDWVTDEARLLNEILATLRDILAALQRPAGTGGTDPAGQHDGP